MATQSNSTSPKAATVAKTVKRDADGIARTVHFAFANGKEFEVELNALTDAIQWEAMAHGISQKIGDATAISRNPDTGKSATVDDKYDAASEVFQRLVMEQTWNAVREGGGNSGGLLLRALIRMYEGKKTAEDVKAWLAAKSKDEQAALRKNAKIAAIIAEIQAESADASIDTDAMLNELGDNGAGE